MNFSDANYFSWLRKCLEMEAEAERARMLQRRQMRSRTDAETRGETLLDLAIADDRPGIGGRTLVTLVKRNRGLELPWHKFRVGSPVSLSPDRDTQGTTYYGVVSARDARSVEVALDEWPELESIRMDLSADEVTRDRLLAALNAASQARGRTAQRRDVLLGLRAPTFQRRAPPQPMPHLNASQRQAIDWALTADNLAILHGPPGTGKTTTVAELIRQAVRQGERVLACAPSNTGVDNLLERLVAMDVLAVRVGHPARVQARLQEHSLDALVENDPSMVAVHRLLRQSEQAARLAQRHTRKRPEPGVKHGHRLESRQLREEAKRLERQILDSWLDRAQVICATTNFDPEVLGPRQFDLGVIDEACQSTEPGYWPVVLRCDRLVLAGDHCQLPPTVLSTEAVQNGYGVSMMERLAGHYGETTTRLLTTQYRMHRNIMQFSSSQFYQDQLIADASVAEHQLVDLSEVRASRWSETPATFLDTAGAGWDEEPDPDGESRLNRKEAQVVIQVVEEMVQSGLAPIDIAVIAPYSAQVRHLRSLSLFADLEIDTVDGFQGREKEAVVITLVRSNTTGEIGFLSDTRRMNVALTRARRKLIVLGDSSTLSNHPFYASMIQYFESIGAYQSVWSHFQVT